MSVNRINSFLKRIPKETQKEAVKGFAEYIMGNDRRGLKHNDPYKFVSRARAYGKVSDAPAGYFSMKQFRYVAAMTKGFTVNIGNNRTGKSSKGYHIVVSDGGLTNTIVNAEAGAIFTRHDQIQARQPALVGWRKALQVVRENMRGAMQSAIQLVNVWISNNIPK